MGAKDTRRRGGRSGVGERKGKGNRQTRFIDEEFEEVRERDDAYDMVFVVHHDQTMQLECKGKNRAMYSA